MLKRAAADAARPEGLAAGFGWQDDGSGYRLSDAQAQAILELRLQRLTGLEQDKIFAEYKDVMAQIVDLIDILAKPSRVTAIVSDELKAIKSDFGDARRSEIVAQGVDLQLEDLIAPQDMRGSPRRSFPSAARPRCRAGPGRRIPPAIPTRSNPLRRTARRPA